jgi:hypothetical protein
MEGRKDLNTCTGADVRHLLPWDCADPWTLDVNGRPLRCANRHTTEERVCDLQQPDRTDRKSAELPIQHCTEKGTVCKPNIGAHSLRILLGDAMDDADAKPPGGVKLQLLRGGLHATKSSATRPESQLSVAEKWGECDLHPRYNCENPDLSLAQMGLDLMLLCLEDRSILSYWLAERLSAR